jgi:hypothetical protein
MTLRPSTHTFGELSLAIKRMFGDESGVQLTDTDIARWANDAQMEIVSNNKALKAKSVISTVVDTATYDFPAVKIQQVESLHFDNSPLPNVPFAQAETQIIQADPQNVSSGTPQFWYEWAGQITLWPKPDAVKDLTLYYTAYPETLTGVSNEFLGVPDKFYNAVVDYCLAKAYEMDEDLNLTQAADARFRAALENQMEDERQAANMAYPVIQEVW